jgi:hypothetical protein
MVDVVALAKELKVICAGHSANVPSQAALASAFQAYQKARYSAVVGQCGAASKSTAAATWQNSIYKFVDTQVVCREVVTRTLISLGARRSPRSRSSNEKAPSEHAAPRAMVAAH